MLPRLLIASRIGMLWIEITPNVVRTPHCSRKAAISSPTVVLLDMSCIASRDIDMTACRVGREVGSQIKECLRGLFGTAEAAKRNVFLACEFGGPLFPALTGRSLRHEAAAPLTGLDDADQNRIHTNALRCEFNRERLDQAQQAGSCRRGRHHMRLRLQCQQ